MGRSRRVRGGGGAPPKLKRILDLPIESIVVQQNSALDGLDSSQQGIVEAKEDGLPPQLDKCTSEDDTSISVASSSNSSRRSRRIGVRDEDEPVEKKKVTPKRIIQTIFAKPKKEKSKKRKGAKANKKSPIRPQHTRVLRVKILPVKKQEDSNDEEVEEESEESRTGKQKDNNGSDGEGHEKSGVATTNNSKTVESNDENEDGFETQEWKPVRAAMVAAMELLAKKQVTEEMRVDRRVRKMVTKPIPPKGRGRRAIFKKLNKPVRSCQPIGVPTVTSFVYYEGTCFQKGDIVCLLQDFDARRRPNLNNHRFFQVNGFLKISVGYDCASLTMLKRTIPAPLPTAPVEEIDPNMSIQWPYPFKLVEYRPAHSKEYMVDLCELKFVMHAPPDFFYGHDVLFNKLNSGIYARLGTPLFEYDEEISLSKKTDDSNNIVSSSQTSYSLTVSRRGSSSTKEENDNESVASCSQQSLQSDSSISNHSNNNAL